MVDRLTSASLPAVLTAVTLFSACKHSGGPNSVPRIVLSPPWTSIEVGDTVTGDTVRAIYVNAQGDTVAPGAVTWSSSDATVATIDATGLVRGVGVGLATVRGLVNGAPASQPMTVTPPVLVGAGDIAICDASGAPARGAVATAALLDSIAGTVFTAGDNAYQDGTAAEFANCYHPTWGRHKWRTRPAPGDHDYNTPGAAGYFNYFGAPAGDPAKGYYSYDLGDWHIIVLNSEVAVSAGSPQEQWLQADLAANPKSCTLAISQTPRFSSGERASNALAAMWQALYEAGAEILISGDDHNYEQFDPQAPDSTLDFARGIRQFVVGTGGRSNGQLFTPYAPNSKVRNNDTFGVIKLTLHPTSYEWQFVPVRGKTFTDAGSENCH